MNKVRSVFQAKASDGNRPGKSAVFVSFFLSIAGKEREVTGQAEHQGLVGGTVGHKEWVPDSADGEQQKGRTGREGMGRQERKKTTEEEEEEKKKRG